MIESVIRVCDDLLDPATFVYIPGCPHSPDSKVDFFVDFTFFYIRLSLDRGVQHHRNPLPAIRACEGMLHSLMDKVFVTAVNIPPSFPIKQAQETLDYDFTKIGDSEFFLPLG